eukprot:scaffold1425_cov333-Prasinococcus_capsulatus_cf.AAC.11
MAKVGEHQGFLGFINPMVQQGKNSLLAVERAHKRYLSLNVFCLGTILSDSLDCNLSDTAPRKEGLDVNAHEDLAKATTALL